MKKSILFAAFISVCMAVSCTDKTTAHDDTLEGENNGTNIGPGKGEMVDSTHHHHDTTNTHLH